MKRLFALVVLLLQLWLPAVALAQTVPIVTVSTPQGGQPPNVTVTPNTAVPAVAVSVTAAASAAASITGVAVQMVGSAPNSAIVALKVVDTENNTLGTATGVGGTNRSATIPITLNVPAGERRTLVVFATVAGNLTAHQGQFFNLNISGLVTSAVIQGTLPLFGGQIVLSSGVAKPTCQISANPSTYTVGQTVTIKWASTGATEGTITGIGAVSPSGQQGILPGGTGTITGTFTGPGGTGTCTTQVTKSSATSDIGSSIGDSGSVDGGGTVAEPGQASGGGSTPTTGGLSSPITNSGSTGPGVSQVCTGIDCQVCHFASLGQKIINFGVGISIPIAAVAFAWAGIMYFTSATSPTNIERAKASFRVALVGFLIAIGAWLAVQTVLKLIMNPQSYQNWTTITCTTVPRSGTPGNYSNFNQVLGILGPLDSRSVSIAPDSVYGGSASGGGGGGDFNGFGIDENGAFTNNPSAGPSGTCANGALYSDAGDGASCFDSEGNVTDVVAYASNADIAAAAQASAGFSTRAGPDEGNLACAWAVNNILKSLGIAPIDGNAVGDMERQLAGSRGALVADTANSPDLTKTKEGDIVVWKDYQNGAYSHVGICLENGCNRVISNSSGDRTFSSVTNVNYNKNWQARIYHVTQR